MRRLVGCSGRQRAGASSRPSGQSVRSHGSPIERLDLSFALLRPSVRSSVCLFVWQTLVIGGRDAAAATFADSRTSTRMAGWF